jgi:hypothetical protein
MASVNTRRMSRRIAASGVPTAMRAAIGTGRRVGDRWWDAASAGEPGGQAAAELAADRGHRRRGERTGLLEAEVVDLQPGDFAVLPAGDDRLGDLIGINAQLGPGVVGPGAQLPCEVGQEHQVTGLAFGVTGD